MTRIDINDLKTQQDELDERERVLLEAFAPFRDAFFARLDQFIQEGEAAGLRDIARVQRAQLERGGFQAELTLNGFRALVFAPNHAWFNHDTVGGRDSLLAARLVVFQSGGNDDALPWMDVTVQEAPNEALKYVLRRIRYPQNDDPEWRYMGQGDVSEGGGHKAAEQLLQFIYGFKSQWDDMANLGAWRHWEGTRGPIGFRHK